MLKIGITQGDTNGIGIEVILKALNQKHIQDICTPIIYGSAKAIGFYKKNLKMDSLSLTLINTIEDLTKAKDIYMINAVETEAKVEKGKASPVAGQQAFQSLERAVSDLKEGKIDALVTAPINKSTIQSEDFQFPGHTEYLESKFEGSEALMILCSENIRVALATTHVPIVKVSGLLTEELILHKLTLLNNALMRDFGIIRPRIAVLGLNAHAGDHGVIGTEEEETIAPAIKQANDKGMICVGPLAADGFFGSGSFQKYDAVLAMYHDQGLAPFKALCMNSGVNFTAGLPIVRTSPDHGTGFDIAGQNRADEHSMIEAIYAAIDIIKQRTYFDEISEHSLTIAPTQEHSYQRKSRPFTPDGNNERKPYDPSDNRSNRNTRRNQNDRPNNNTQDKDQNNTSTKESNTREQRNHYASSYASSTGQIGKRTDYPANPAPNSAPHPENEPENQTKQENTDQAHLAPKEAQGAQGETSPAQVITAPVQKSTQESEHKPEDQNLEPTIQK